MADPTNPDALSDLFTTSVWTPPPPGGEIINHMPSVKCMFQRFDRLLLTKACSRPRRRMAALNGGNKAALIGIGIYM